jgi:hypothetical protein
LAKEKRKEFYYIQNKIQRSCAMHADGVNIDITKLENLKLELKNYELEKCKGNLVISIFTPSACIAHNLCILFCM